MPKLFVDDTLLQDVTNLDGNYRNCILSGTLAPAPGAQVVFFDCMSGHDGMETPILNMSASVGSNVSFRSYSGGITFENVIDSGFLSTVEFIAGQMVISSSCTAGLVSVRGIAALNDSSTMTVETASLVNAGSFNNITATAVPDPVVSERVKEVWQLHGLDSGSALTVTQTARTFAAVSQSIVTVGSGSEQQTTITREP